jgi:hypothetical protein
VEGQEHDIGTVCAAVPAHAGSALATLANFRPLHQKEQLQIVVEQLRYEVGALLHSLVFSIGF